MSAEERPTDGLAPLLTDILRKYGGTMKGRGDHDIFDALVRYRDALRVSVPTEPHASDGAHWPSCRSCGEDWPCSGVPTEPGAPLDVERLAQAIQDVDFAADLPASGKRTVTEGTRRKASRYAREYESGVPTEPGAPDPETFRARMPDSANVVTNADGSVTTTCVWTEPPDSADARLADRLIAPEPSTEPGAPDPSLPVAVEPLRPSEPAPVADLPVLAVPVAVDHPAAGAGVPLSGVGLAGSTLAAGGVPTGHLATSYSSVSGRYTASQPVPAPEPSALPMRADPDAVEVAPGTRLHHGLYLRGSAPEPSARLREADGVLAQAQMIAHRQRLAAIGAQEAVDVLIREARAALAATPQDPEETR